MLCNLSKTKDKVFSIEFTDFFFSNSFSSEGIKLCASISSSDYTCTIGASGVDGVIVVTGVIGVDVGVITFVSTIGFSTLTTSSPF